MKERIVISSLLIEVTRRCNITCDHCLRGELQNLDINNEHITQLLSNFNHIGSITFTGGEPSLNVSAIQHFISELKRQKITLDSFYIATNAKNVKQDFVQVIMDLYMISRDKEMCRVDVSNDYYHMLNDSGVKGSKGRETLEMLKFTSTKNEDDNYAYRYGAVNEGNYADYFGDGRNLKADYIIVEEDCITNHEGQFYLNALGQITSCCDLSYTSQKLKKEFQVCNVYADDYLKEIEGYNKRLAEYKGDDVKEINVAA